MSSNFSFSIEELMYFQSSKDQSLPTKLDYSVKCTWDTSRRPSRKAVEGILWKSWLGFLRQYLLLCWKRCF